MKTRQWGWFAGVLALCSHWAMATEGYRDHAAARALVDEVVAESGLERESLLALLAEARRQDSILEAISRPAEKVKPWHEYRKIFLTERREQEGREFMQQHRETLARAELLGRQALKHGHELDELLVVGLAHGSPLK